LREHTCDDLGASFFTALNSCPICRERLDVGPSFPSSVAHYLRRTKVANKFNVTFDYETELFVPVEDGEFVLISNSNEAGEPIVLPRSARFKTRRDFYEFYQDYYHCPKPDAGEVHIIQPASVVPTVAGWKLLAPGILEVLEDHPKEKASADDRHRQVDALTQEESGLSIAAMKEESPVTTCTHCGLVVETRYAFCWKCGNPLTSKPPKPPKPLKSPKNESSSVTHSEPRAIIASDAVETDDEELTLQHDLHPVSSPMFSWALAKEPEQASSAKGSVLKLVAVAVLAGALISLGLFGLTRSASRMASATAAQPATPNPQSNESPAPNREVKGVVAKEATPLRTSAAPLEEEELNDLRKRRIAATASDRSAILRAFAKAEKQFANDYRFPYERAKLAITLSQSKSHDEAFNALHLAAEKAINSGKASEMLDGLEVDKTGDFHKLSHGHHEWNQLAEALKSKDPNLLGAK